MTETHTVPPGSNISEASLLDAYEKGVLSEIELHETPKGFYIKVKLSTREEWFYLTNKRNRQEPRNFAMPDRLLTYIKNNFPTVQKIKLFFGN
jgi:hypothetical protein